MIDGENGKKRLRLALIGKDVSDSESEEMHRFILRAQGAECDYEKISVSAEEFGLCVSRLLKETDGFNITIPYKAEILPYLSATDGEAAAFGAVNTVLTHAKARGGDGKAEGRNTDGRGFLTMLESAGVETAKKKFLVLGAGGAGRSVAATLRRAGAEVLLYRRNQALLREICDSLGVKPVSDPEAEPCDVLVNCTGVGMHDSAGVSPVGEGAIGNCSVAVDLIYRPAESEFLRIAKRLGKRALNGRAMLFYQAYFADCLYSGKPTDEAFAEKLYGEYLSGKGEQEK